jgi:LPS-assembly protein
MNFYKKLFLSLLLTLVAPHAYAKESFTKTVNVSSDKPADIEADSLSYDKKNLIATAQGHVEVSQGDMILIADKVVYDQKNNTVEAEGNVSLREPDGNVFFADKMSLKDDLKKGVINKLSAKFVDKSTMEAERAEKIDENITILDNAFYTPCTVCKDENHKNKAPLWNFSAERATINEQAQTITYKNAFFKVKDVPIIYTPYLSHPTPGADRKSGFLIPKYSTDHVFGTTVKLPYYLNIATNQDLILTPIITTDEGPILTADYRHLLKSGSYELKGSITDPKKIDENGNETEGNKIRGHIEGKGKFNLDDIWSWGFDGKRSSDDTYLKRYSFGDEDVLVSNIYANAIKDRNFFNIESVTFQGLKTTDDPGKTPLILPNATGHYESQPGFAGSRWKMDSNFLSLNRDEGVSSQRISLKGGWTLPHVTQSGHVFEFSTSLRGDGYDASDVAADPLNPHSTTTNANTVRVIPQAELKWTFPLVKQMATRQIFIEPTANFILSPNGGNPNKIPNEDSQGIEFSDDNIFDDNHFDGYDRVEGGPRMNYGVRSKIFDPEKGEFGFLFGENYHLDKNQDFSERSGLSDNFSDYAGRLSYQKDDIFNAAYSFRLDSKTFSSNRNSVSASLKLAPVKFSLDYVSVSDSSPLTDPTLTDSKDQIIIASGSIDLSEQWNLSSEGNRNLDSGEWVSTKAVLLYKGDCVGVSTEWFREFTRDRDVVPNTTLSVQIHLKNFGY